MSKKNSNTVRCKLYEQLNLRSETKIVPTTEDWFPSLNADGIPIEHWIDGKHVEYGDETPKFVEVRLRPDRVTTENATWHISFWGGDDTGMNKVFASYEEAKEQFDLLTKTGTISFADLESLEFEPA